MEKIWKNNLKIMLIIVLDIIIIAGTTYATTSYLYESSDIGYDNSNSGLVATDVQGALDEVYRASTDYSVYDTRLSTLEAKIGNIQELYPVGSIYIGVNNTNPSTYFGGTWVAFGTGKTLVGIDTNDASFDTAEETGGAKTKSYTPAGTIGGTSLTIAQLPSHSHSIPSLSGSTNTTGAHTHAGETWVLRDAGNGFWSHESTSQYGTYNSPWLNDASWYTASAGNHSHTVTTNASTTGTTGSGNTHKHSFTGTAANINVVQPYITVYMWKRTA